MLERQGGTRRAAVRRAGAAATGAALAVGGVRTAAAHHSYPATYDTTQRVTVSGVVQLVRFANPHVHIVLEGPAPAAGAPEETVRTVVQRFQEGVPAEDAPGAPEPLPPLGPPAPPPTLTLWVLDLPGPGRASQIGLTPETLPPGTSLTVEAWPARAPGSHDLAPVSITFDADGHTVHLR